MPYPSATLIPSPSLMPAGPIAGGAQLVQQIALGARRTAVISSTGPRTATAEQPKRSK